MQGIGAEDGYLSESVEVEIFPGPTHSKFTSVAFPEEQIVMGQEYMIRAFPRDICGNPCWSNEVDHTASVRDSPDSSQCFVSLSATSVRCIWFPMQYVTSFGSCVKEPRLIVESFEGFDGSDRAFRGTLPRHVE
jgi:hypothetical protein